MSIASKLSRLSDARDNIIDALGDQGVTATGHGFEDFATDIASISGSATLQVKTNINPTTSSQTITADNGYDGLSSVQINAMPSGSATTPATTISSSPSISVSSSGLITASNSKTQSVIPTVSAGYVSSGTAGTITVNGSNTKQLTTQAAQTIYPSTSDQTIASGKYLTGTQTIKGVLLTNLSAGNIKKDVVVKVGDSADDDRITAITGTYEGSGGGDSGDETVAEVAFGTFGNNTLSFDLSTTSISSISDLYGYAIINLKGMWLSSGAYLANMFMTFSPASNGATMASAIINGASSLFCAYCSFTLSNTTLSSTTMQYYELGNNGESLEIYSPSSVLLFYIPYKLLATISSVGSFTFTNGTTWTTFVNSADNTLGLVITSGYVKSGNYYVIYSTTSEYASSSAKIYPGTYSLTSSAPGPTPPGPGW